ncbi:hypothetical protein ABZV61_37945 [Streptomyces sp900116325]|uniref:Short subunit dehydrogenase n=1 Tax=Streptomyces sp. 900116325 TaxID=3154295 RepID=A0ABV2UKL9_9ACTN
MGGIDIVVSNAGYGMFGAAEEFTDEQIAHHLATSLTGSLSTARARDTGWRTAVRCAARGPGAFAVDISAHGAPGPDRGGAGRPGRRPGCCSSS